MTFLKRCDLKLPAEIGSLNICPVLNSFLVTTPRGHLEGSCLLPVPGPWEYKVLISAAFIVAVTKKQHKEAAFLHVPLSFFLFLDIYCYFTLE